MSRVLHAPARRHSRELVRHVLAYVLIVLVSTIVATFAMLEPAAFIVGAGTGAGVAVLILTPGLAVKLWRRLNGEDEDGQR